MKILITTDLYTTSTNGVVTSVKNLVGELNAKGHDVKILTLSECKHSYKRDGVYYIRSIPFAIYPNVRVPISYKHKLLKEIIAWKPDIIHSQCELSTMTYAKIVQKKTGAPIVHTYHTMYEEYVGYLVPGKRLGRWVVRFLTHNRLKTVSNVIVPTEKIKIMLEGYGLKKPIYVIPTGIDLGRYQKRITEERREKLRAQYAVAPGKTLLLNLGRLGTEKNIDELIEFYGQIIKQSGDFAFMIVGDGPARVELEKKALELGLSDKIIFTGMVDPKNVFEYYQAADIFVSASTSETQGLTYVEAAANAIPLLCRKDPCLDGVIYEGVNGYTYTSEEQFISALVKMASDSVWIKKAGAESERIVSKFDKKLFGDRVEKLYRDTVNKNRQ